MKIGILGAGNIGGTLGKHWAAAGHAVRFGVRSPGDSKYSQELGGDAQIVSMADALAFGDVILVAVPGKVVADVAAEYGTKLNGKIVIDATNQPGQAEMNSLRVLVQSAPQAKFCRAFNTLGWENFAQPTLNDAPIDLFYCGAAAAKEPLATLITDAGMHPIYVGDIDLAPVIDNLTRLWFSLAHNQGLGRRIALKLVREGQ
jgi:hypothetical protein